jgi:hypothetical protein
MPYTAGAVTVHDDIGQATEDAALMRGLSSQTKKAAHLQWPYHSHVYNMLSNVTLQALYSPMQGQLSRDQR